MNPSRRSFLRGLAVAAGTTSAARTVAAQHQHQPVQPSPRDPTPERPVRRPAGGSAPEFAPGIVGVETPDLPKMQWHWDSGVKVFRLRTGHVRTQFLPGRVADVWGFNESMPGPTIEVQEGDRVRFIVENGLPEPFSMHWHGLEVPINMDGAPGISQPLIPPGGTFTYEFMLHQNGTFFYHSHGAMQEMMGMIGLFIIHPRRSHAPRVDRDFGLILQEWAILPNNTIPNTLAMEFNWLTINGKAGPATTPMLVKLGERVRIRMVNLGMDHHPMHLHGTTFYITGTEAGRIHTTAREPGNTVLVGVAQARDIEFEATNPGDWMLHCHLPHHMMNQMVSMVGPMTMSHGGGMRSGAMEPGMGIVEGRALDERTGAALGRTVAVVGGEAERPVPNLPLSAIAPPQSAATEEPNTGMFPGYPQDMFMVMDDLFKDKPETYGLQQGWTIAMMGMMTLVRVLEPAMFDRIQAIKAERAAKEVAP